MVSYESNIGQKNLASLMLKKPSYVPKLSTAESDRREMYGNSYNTHDINYNYGPSHQNLAKTRLNEPTHLRFEPSSYTNNNITTNLSLGRTNPKYFNENFYPQSTKENESIRSLNSRVNVPTTKELSHDKQRPRKDSEMEAAKHALQMENQQHYQTSPPNKSINKNHLTTRKKYKNKISANISGTKFDIVRRVLESMEVKILSDDNFDGNLIWDDTRVSIEGISELKAFQRYNHFPAMSEISKKDALARNISKITKILPKDFDFVPKTWIMPTDYSSLLSYSIDMKKLQQKKTYIMKPANGAMGHGIKLYKNVEKIQPTENFIVQEYISNPYLIDGFKFDLRIYALVTSCDPLRAFIYNNGLVRLGTEEYQEPHESNIDHLYMHLTNYSVNKRNRSNYDEGDEMGETGTKRSLKFLFDHLRRNNIDSSKVWRNIQDIILKTLLVAEPYLFHTYKMCRPGQIPGTESVCFEILGFDILIDDNMRPWVLEVNRCPSFGANQQIDIDIKSRLLFDSFDLLHLRVSDRSRCQAIEKAESKRRLYNLNSYSSRTDMISSMNNYETKPIIHSFSSSNLTSTNNSKKYKSKDRRKAEIIEQIKLMKREEKRQEYENRNLGNFSRLFPKDEKAEMNYYLNILNTAFNLFYPVGKHLQWKKTYEKIKEEELLSELIECDDDVYNGSNDEQFKRINEKYLRDDYMSTESEESRHSSDQEDYRDHQQHRQPHRHYTEYSDHHRSEQRYEETRNDDGSRYREDTHEKHNHDNQDPDQETRENRRQEKEKTMKSLAMKSMIEQQAIKSNRIATLLNAIATPSSTTLTNPMAANLRLLNKAGKRSESDLSVTDDKTIEIMNASNDMNSRLAANLVNQIRLHQAKQSNLLNSKITTAKSEEKEELANNNIATLNIAVLKLLNQLEIKYPGKNGEETKTMLQKIYTKFELYKPKLANYWMAKLDDNKRIKILNIVKSNVVVILRKVFMVETVENLRLYTIFVKLLNRMLWMHGQGLWNCFVSSNNSSWESIFSKSSFQVTESEFKCCYRIVELCKDCVLIVYQYAFEQKPNGDYSSINKNSSASLNTSSFIKQKSASISSLNSSANKLKL